MLNKSTEQIHASTMPVLDSDLAEMTPDAGLAFAAIDTHQDVVVFANRAEKTYGNGTRALNEVSLKIRRGEFISLLGPSGCGKSTLLKMFAGLEQPSAGHVTLWGRDPLKLSSKDLRVAMVFQEATLMPWATVADNVRLPLDLRGIPKLAAQAKVQQALEQVGLGQFAHASPHELSGGMQMRVSLARALVTEPDLLLMDEPFGALDEFTRNQLNNELHALACLRQLTVVFVTHSIAEAAFLSSRVVVMAARPGRIVDSFEIEISGRRVRHDDYRVTPTFFSHCQRLSTALISAHHTTHSESNHPNSHQVGSHHHD